MDKPAFPPRRGGPLSRCAGGSCKLEQLKIPRTQRQKRNVKNVTINNGFIQPIEIIDQQEE
jgi:hypothetical protein